MLCTPIMSTATASLTLRALFGRAAGQLGFDQLPAVMAGLSPAAKAFVAASVCRSTPATTMLVVPTDKDV